MKKRLQFLLIFVFIVSTILAGCNAGIGNSGKNDNSSKESKTLKEMGKDEKATIKVMYSDERFFFQQYGNLFASKFPNIEVKVVSTQGLYGPGKDPKAEFDKLVEAEKPDVFLFNNIDQFEKMAADGRLLELDSVIKQDKFDIENILPAIRDLLKSKGNGRLYGLAPTFFSNALLYNKDLFDQNGVPYPKDQMSWEEVLQLAKRFPTTGDEDKRIYGFFANAAGLSGKNSIFPLANMFGATEGMSFIDPEKLKVTIQTDDWKRVIQNSIDLTKSNVINQPKPQTTGVRTMEEYLKSDLFATGRAAMMVGGYYSLNTIDQVKKQLKDVKPFNWDVVTVPVDPKKPNETGSFGVSELYAINTQSTQQRAAWELVKYLNSDELAKVQSRSTQQLLTRTSYIKEKDGHSLEAFYKLKQKTIPYKGAENVIPSNFYQTFFSLVDDEMQPVLDGKKSLDDALKAIQDKGQQALDQAAAEANAKKDPAKK